MSCYVNENGAHDILSALNEFVYVNLFMKLYIYMQFWVERYNVRDKFPGFAKNKA